MNWEVFVACGAAYLAAPHLVWHWLAAAMFPSASVICGCNCEECVDCRH